MWKKRLIRFGLLVTAVISATALILALSVGTSKAQGPSGDTGHRGYGAGDGPHGVAPVGYAQGTGEHFGNNAGFGVNLNTNLNQYGTDISRRNNNDQTAGMGGDYFGNGIQAVSGIELPPASGELSEDAITALYEGIQDEYHAYAVYQAVIDQFGSVSPFTQIQATEAQHIAALESLFNRYGLTIPQPEPLDELPVFDSVTDACTLGAQAEIANFELYDRWIDMTSDYPDLVQVFTALRNASEFNHLPAFGRCAV